MTFLNKLFDKADKFSIHLLLKPTNYKLKQVPAVNTTGTFLLIS
ncbi:hypothetical protein SAMN05444682_10949 [Parapedobacter indicus]|uniref:Uncharacterized protein n=1 Tax=Parapedobacter indicus TaxID=1477437 RepID=A0A1I3QNM6_9SPHI|nr:hypothetical protein CLV26_10949 [Parapedobacter indicus]SFJ35109.1 hypothetical protein SAMN05444682_10949 [Parapedobacter indicus]